MKQNTDRFNSKKLLSIFFFWLVMALLLQSNQMVAQAYEQIPKRLPNKKRKRDHLIEKLESFSNDEFKNQTGLSRRCFTYILAIIHDTIKVNHKMAEISSGSHISSMMRLFIHQRLLKGMKTLDADWMGVDPNHIWKSVWKPVALAIDENLNNVNFHAGDRIWLEQQAQQWKLVQTKKYGFPFTDGLVAAGDGLIVKIKKLSQKCLKQIDIVQERFWNRKGYYGLNAEAFCDAWCRFVSFEMCWPGSTNDITAYKGSDLYFDVDDYMSDEFYFALDEAYKSIRDGKHLTPFSAQDIQEAMKADNTYAAEMMRTFNKISSSVSSSSPPPLLLKSSLSYTIGCYHTNTLRRCQGFIHFS